MSVDLENSTLNRSHFKGSPSFEKTITDLKEKIRSRGDLPHVTVQRQFELIDQLCDFPFGRFILDRKGANGYWTDYIISYPTWESNPDTLSEVAEFITQRSLLVLAHRERFKNFQSLLQKTLKNGSVLASVPCGVMRDLITLDFSETSDYKLIGLDIDPESLDLARISAEEHGIKSFEFFQQDAWQIRFKEKFDVITSSGLNVYESDPVKILDLYRRFFDALKPGGSLIISVLTYPPGESRETDWNLAIIPPEDLLMETILYKDICDQHWRNFRSSGELENEFKQVGFSDIEVYFDKFRLFPTIHAKKPL